MIRIIVFFCFVISIYSQIKFTHLTIEDGLSQSTVFRIEKDKFGYMWFGTSDGLNRYDGYNFRIFQNDKTDSTSISSGFIRGLYVDKSNRTWAGTINGLNYFDPSDNQIHRISEPYLKTANITDIHADESALWLRFRRDGFGRFDLNTFQFEHFTETLNEFSNKSVNALVVQNELIWFGLESGLYTVTLDQKNKTRIVPEGLKSFAVQTMVPYSFDTLLVSAREGLYFFSTKTNQFTKIELSQPVPRPTSILVENSHTIWIGTLENGLFIHNLKTEVTQNYQFDPLEKSSISGNFIESIYKDNNGLIWVGNNAAGINIFDPYQQKFKHFKMNHKNYPTDNVIYALFSEKENSHIIWIGTEKAGLNRLDRNTGEYTVYLPDPNKNSIFGKSVRAIYEDSEKNLWFGTSDAGISILRKKTGRFEHFGKKNSALQRLSIRTIFEDKKEPDIIWVGTANSGLLKTTKNGELLKSYSLSEQSNNGLNNTDIRSAIMDTKNIIWVGTLGGGLNRFDPVSETFRYYTHNSTDSSSISNNIVLSIFEVDSQNTQALWIGTGGGGFSYFETKSGKFTNYSEHDGLSNNVVYVAIPDHNGNIWATTNNGVSRFNPQTKKFKNFGVQDGLQSSEFNVNAYASTSKNEIIIGGINGFNIFHPDEIIQNPLIPEIYLTEFNVFENPYLFKTDISNIKSIQLAYDENFISFRYTALNFSAPNSNQYQYKMNGFDSDWINAKNRRYVNYTNLPYGDYIFTIRASNNDGLWNMQGKKIKIHVETPPWLTWWAYCIYILVSILLLWASKWIISNWRYLISPRTTFIGKYKLLSTLGIGSMSKVYEAYDPDRKKMIAIKVVENEENTADDMLRMFIKEAELGKQLQHENIVQVFDAGTTAEQRYLTMEKVSGQTLRSIITNGDLTSKEQEFIFTQLLQGLEYLHSNSIIHRDFKSSNILVDLENKLLKITDFGLATSKNLISLNERSNLVGTLAYMSPEQTIGRQVDHRTDIYALGVILYELLFKELPFFERNEMALIFSIHNETPEQFIVSKHPWISIIKRCMDKNPDERFQSINEVKTAFLALSKNGAL